MPFKDDASSSGKYLSNVSRSSSGISFLALRATLWSSFKAPNENSSDAPMDLDDFMKAATASGSSQAPERMIKDAIRDAATSGQSLNHLMRSDIQTSAFFCGMGPTMQRDTNADGS